MLNNKNIKFNNLYMYTYSCYVYNSCIKLFKIVHKVKNFKNEKKLKNVCYW